LKQSIKNPGHEDFSGGEYEQTGSKAEKLYQISFLSCQVYLSGEGYGNASYMDI
jgi:hypothetical protein